MNIKHTLGESLAMVYVKLMFTDFYFFFFLAVSVLLYFIFPKKMRWYVLLTSSLGFYVTWGKKRLLMVIVAGLFSYVSAIMIEKSKKKSLRRLWCGLGLILVLLMLFYAKIGNSLFESKFVIVPLGISYYTFSLISYLLDVYWKKQHAEKNVLKHFLFILYFPKILEGPIEKERNLLPKLVEGHDFDYQRFCFGLQLIIYGLFKKLVIAERLCILTGNIFCRDFWNVHSGSIIVLGAVLRAFELYMDFSGCMDMACGMSELFGISLTKNFNLPFFSKTAAEFWRRWHITLNSFFKDYVYMPIVINPHLIQFSAKVRKLCGKRAGKAVMTVVPLYVIWILTGLWHGDGKKFIVWGLYWGTVMAFSAVFEPELKQLAWLCRIDTDSHGWKVFQMIRTFCLFAFGRLITAHHFRHALRRIASDFCVNNLFDGTIFTLGLDAANFFVMAAGLLIVWKISLCQNTCSVREKVAGYSIVMRWSLYLGAFFTVLIFGMYGPGYNPSDFEYVIF